MEITKRAPIAAAIIFGMLFASCNYDPWQSGDMPTDIVSVTKITRTSGTGEAGEPAYTSRVGTVRMSHKVHEDEGLKCIECHHKENNPEREKKCAACHQGDNGYETMHGLCVDCHIARKEGPQQCGQCH